MQQVTIPTDPSKRLSVLSRSLAHRRPERPPDNSLDPLPQPVAATDSNVATGFDLVAKSLLAMTPASGVAVAVLDETGLYCRASAGEAPPPGTAIRMENTISGQCIRSGATFYCDETLVRCPNALPARSILLLPMMSGRKARGLVALFSRKPQAFAPASTAIARSAAALMAIALNTWAPQLDCPLDEQVLEVDIFEPAPLPNPAPRAAELRPAPVPVPPATPPPAPAATRDTPSTPASLPRPYKVLVGLPCANCGAYFAALEPRCCVCNTPR